MATIYLIEGPVGAGKSTLATKLAAQHKAPHLDLDEFMVTLFSPDRPKEGFMQWYAERKRRCISQIFKCAQAMLDQNIDVVIELGLVQKQDRQEFYARTDAIDHTLKVFVVETPTEIRRQRVRERNQKKTGTFKMPVSDDIFDLANRFWQPPDDNEIRERNIKLESGQ